MKDRIFIITGILDSLERDDAIKLIEAHGGYFKKTERKKERKKERD
ncbi:hypothetical protein M1146_05955 [Patescibacteria group bacterium]|nr:hypothetical protein [Patescibacteria group bacterium]